MGDSKTAMTDIQADRQRLKETEGAGHTQKRPCSRHLLFFSSPQFSPSFHLGDHPKTETASCPPILILPFYSHRTPLAENIGAQNRDHLQTGGKETSVLLKPINFEVSQQLDLHSKNYSPSLLYTHVLWVGLRGGAYDEAQSLLLIILATEIVQDKHVSLLEPMTCSEAFLWQS